MPRQTRIDYPGALQHIIGRGIERRTIFKEDADKHLFLKIIKGQISQSSVQIYAWSIMDNHFHLLLQTGKTGLSEFMRKVLTAYAVNYNKKNKRSGHLFQNRYKSILCDRDEYLLPLIRYIHLNPVKAKKIDIGKLDKYAWTGNKEIVEKEEDGIIERAEVLGYFGRTEKKAIEAYKEYIREGIEQEEDYEGGGLIRSAGGIKNLIGAKQEEHQMYDERILGDGGFVEEILNSIEQEEGKRVKIKGMEQLLEKLGIYYKQDTQQIIQTRKKGVWKARQVFVYIGNRYLNKSITELGRYIGISQTAASKAMSKGREIEEKERIFEKIA